MTFVSRQSVKRAGATAALAVAVLSATGCGYIYEQPTTLHYDASDGVSTDVGDVKMRNIMMITNDAQSDGRMLGSVLNDSENDLTVKVDTGKSTAEIKVPGHTEVKLQDQQTLFSPAGAEPGAMLKDTKFEVGTQTSSTDVPVLDGTLEEYRQYVPGGSDYTPPAKPTEGHEH